MRAFPFLDVVARQRHAVDALGQLDLEHHVTVRAEGDLAADQIKLPHAAEALVIDRADAVAMLVEAAAPLAQRFGIVQTQDLDIRDPQASALDDRQNFGERWDIAAREDVFADPGTGGAGTVGAANRVEQGDAVVGQQIAHLVEELAVVVDADMLEHADRDDAVELAGLLAIVAQVEPDAVAEAGAGGALVGALV